MTNQARLNQLRTQLKPKQAVLISNHRDIFYFTNFISLVPEEREAFLILTQKQNLLLHNSFSPYKSQTQIQAHQDCSLKNLVKTLQKLQTEDKIKSLLVDESNLHVDEYKTIKQLDIKLLPLERKTIWQLRTVKDQAEIQLLKKAGNTTRDVMTQIWKKLEVGLSEIEVRNLIEAELKKKNSQRPAFPTIVAFGSNTALPHHQPTEKKLTMEMPVLIDFGATLNGYCGDMTRSDWFGKKPPKKYLKIKELVHSAYQTALQSLKLSEKQKKSIKASSNDVDQPLLLASDIDKAARTVITKAGYAQNFIHTTGHGLGLDIHESLSLAQNNQQLLQPGMVITLEPGIYLEGQFGYRYENMVLLTQNGGQELTT